ncbi:hypothetical protein MNBD_GAMMA07-1019 [hydrothermal vent metagenome]|uniref:Methyl-accepting chemotaxis protein n=1 Tax=hydrothermal vent metagenome TaxID=652676 RepID=A0A3B0WX16_9ZZZZ
MSNKKIKNIREIIIESIECEPGVKGCTANPDTCPNSPDVCDKKLSMFGYYDETIKGSVEDTLSKSLDKLTNAFTISTKKWEKVVYPAMFAFILLSIYGFFLIYNLTKDMSTVTHEMVSISKNMAAISTDVHAMNIIMEHQSHHIAEMNQVMKQQSHIIGEMNNHMLSMSTSVNQMRYDLSIMNSSISKPMNFMNSFMPW